MRQFRCAFCKGVNIVPNHIVGRAAFCAYCYERNTVPEDAVDAAAGNAPDAIPIAPIPSPTTEPLEAPGYSLLGTLGFLVQGVALLTFVGSFLVAYKAGPLVLIGGACSALITFSFGQLLLTAREIAIHA